MRLLPSVVVVALFSSACGGRPQGNGAVHPEPTSRAAAQACERRLLCNAPTCECSQGYHCAAAGDDCRAECVRNEPTAGDDASGTAECGVCELQLRECEENRNASCAENDARCRELCGMLAVRRDVEPGGPCPCAPGLCCRNERCTRNELVYFSPYAPTSDPVAPEDEGTVLRGVFLLCAIE
jgi:hypothetical protein